MKLNEFKAWFEGYTESMEGAPSKKQWERIKEQVAAVDGVAITPYSYPVYIDRYVRPYYPQYWGQAMGVGNVSTVLLSGQAQNSANYVSALNNSSQSAGQSFDGASAMYAAGKAEAAIN